jgi:ribosomal protein S18 acetylase RimI-like enzyme
LYIRKRIPGKDDPALISIVVDNFKVHTDTIKFILKYASEVLVLVDDDEEIAGFVSYRFRLGNLVYLDYVVLDFNYQGQGIATKFLPVFENHLLKQGIQTVYGTVDEENTDALKLFKRFGFKEKAKILSSIIIEKQLTSNDSIDDQIYETAPVRIDPTKASYVRKLNIPPSLGRVKH